MQCTVWLYYSFQDLMVINLVIIPFFLHLIHIHVHTTFFYFDDIITTQSSFFRQWEIFTYQYSRTCTLYQRMTHILTTHMYVYTVSFSITLPLIEMDKIELNPCSQQFHFDFHDFPRSSIGMFLQFQIKIHLLVFWKAIERLIERLVDR